MAWRGLGGHRRYLQRHRPKRRRKALSAGTQRELLETPLHSRRVRRMARQQEDDRSRTAMSQDRSVPGATEGGAVLLQCVGLRGAAAHVPLPVHAAALPGLSSGPGLHAAGLPSGRGQREPLIVSGGTLTWTRTHTKAASEPVPHLNNSAFPVRFGVGTLIIGTIKNWTVSVRNKSSNL